MKTNILIGLLYVAFVVAFLAGEVMTGAGLLISANVLIAARLVKGGAQ